jgi:hypothetical protein
MLTGREPAELRSSLVPVEDGREMLAGTTARLLQVPFVARPDGLLLPATAVPMPLHLVGVYITAAEVFGMTPSPAVIAEQLERTSFGAVLNFLASTLALHRRPGVPVERPTPCSPTSGWPVRPVNGSATFCWTRSVGSSCRRRCTC